MKALLLLVRKFIAKVKVFQKQVKIQGQGHKLRYHVKVLSWTIGLWC